jgi:hypothetical protein
MEPMQDDAQFDPVLMIVLPHHVADVPWTSGALYTAEERRAAANRVADAAAAEQRHLEGLRANESLPVGDLGLICSSGAAAAWASKNPGLDAAAAVAFPALAPLAFPASAPLLSSVVCIRRPVPEPQRCPVHAAGVL